MAEAKRRVVVIGAGQLGATFSVLLDRWQQVHDIRPGFEVHLVEKSSQVLMGATRASWIDHATGFEYFKRGEFETARACIEGSITKRLLLPKDLHVMPERIRNRFFVSSESNRSKDVIFDEFYAQARRGAQMYRSMYEHVVRSLPESDDLLFKPDDFLGFVARHEYHGVSGDHVVGGLQSAGGVSNTPMDYAFKIAALERAVDHGTVVTRCSTSVASLVENDGSVTVVLQRQDGHLESVEADYVVFTSAHGITELVKKVPCADQRGAYHLNFMLHVRLPPTSDEVLRDDLSSVNFVLQGQNGGMYACVVPPTAHDEGLAAMFVPGYGASYVDEYATNVHARPPVAWDQLIEFAGFPGRLPKIQTVVERIAKLNPFLCEYVDKLDPNEHRVAVGSVFNPHGDIRSLRRLVAPTQVAPNRRIFTMTSPKWTTSELAALTLLHHVLLRYDLKPSLGPIEHGFGPYRIDVATAARWLRLDGISINRAVAERYLESLELPKRVLPNSHPLY